MVYSPIPEVAPTNTATYGRWLNVSLFASCTSLRETILGFDEGEGDECGGCEALCSDMQHGTYSFSKMASRERGHVKLTWAKLVVPYRASHHVSLLRIRCRIGHSQTRKGLHEEPSAAPQSLRVRNAEFHGSARADDERTNLNVAISVAMRFNVSFGVNIFECLGRKEPE